MRTLGILTGVCVLLALMPVQQAHAAPRVTRWVDQLNGDDGDTGVDSLHAWRNLSSAMDSASTNWEWPDTVHLKLRHGPFHLGTTLDAGEYWSGATKPYLILEGDPRGTTVTGVDSLLSIDPVHVANESRLVAFVPGDEAEPALDLLRQVDVSAGAALIGNVTGRITSGTVTLITPYGGRRPLTMLSGEQLPRIC